MSKKLDDLLLLMRQHNGFQELLSTLESPMVKTFKTSLDAAKQNAEWIFSSGRARENEIWREFLMTGNSLEGNIKPSDKEKT